MKGMVFQTFKESLESKRVYFIHSNGIKISKIFWTFAKLSKKDNKTVDAYRQETDWGDSCVQYRQCVSGRQHYTAFSQIQLSINYVSVGNNDMQPKCLNIDPT